MNNDQDKNNESSSSNTSETSSESELSIMEYINHDSIDIFSENINFYAYSLEENSFNYGINEITKDNLYYARYVIYFDLDSFVKKYDKSYGYILILKPIFSATYTKKEGGTFETNKMYIKEKMTISKFNEILKNKKVLFEL